LLDSETPNPDKESRAHEKIARRADVLILGVGSNGHIAFNEPRSSFSSKTRLVNLSYDTLKRINMIKDALTIGVSTILSAKKIILLASGYNKSKAIRHLLKAKKSNIWPISALKRHKNLIVILDKIKNI
jgi:glucosamine-6-phosphate deaminase